MKYDRMRKKVDHQKNVSLLNKILRDKIYLILRDQGANEKNSAKIEVTFEVSDTNSVFSAVCFRHLLQ
jgi:hypothetical protein